MSDIESRLLNNTGIMNHNIILFYQDKQTDNDKNISKLFTFYGIKYLSINIQNTDYLIDLLDIGLLNEPSCLILSSKTLESIIIQFKSINKSFRRIITRHCITILVYDLIINNEIISFFSTVSDGAIRTICSLNKTHTNQIKVGFDKICDTFSGILIDNENDDIDAGIIYNKNCEKITNYLSVTSASIFLKYQIHNFKLFILSCKKIMDIDVQCYKNLDVKKHFSLLIPMIMFLNEAFEGIIWKCKKKQACLIIDDPLLCKNYGNFNYIKMLNLMDKRNFFTNIAFIPWNYKRVDKIASKIITDRSDRYSLSIHGCDHTSKEFNSKSYEELNTKILISKSRMLELYSKKSIPFEKVMIFPQGAFSKEAMRILKSHNFMGVVNSTFIPVDKMTSIIKLSELLKPAVMTFEGMPLYVRRYSSDGLANFALDLFLGKPCLIVEHQEYFKNGYKKLSDFIAKINSTFKDLKWCGLEEIIKKTYLENNVSEKIINVRVFSNNFVIKNKNEYETEYHVSKDNLNSGDVKALLIDGKEQRNNHRNDLLKIKLRLKPKQSVTVCIKYHNKYKELAPYTFNSKYMINTALRRYLSEFRDRIVSKNDISLYLYNKIRIIASLYLDYI